MQAWEKLLCASILLGPLLSCAGAPGPDVKTAQAGRPIVLETAKYGPYFRRTREAEDLLLAGELEPALQAYEAAFAGVGFRFARDVCIAAQIAACLKDDARTEELLGGCVRAGVPLEFCGGSALFEGFRGKEAYRRLLAREPALLQEHEAGIDHELKAEVERRFAREQQAKNGDKEAYFAVVDENVKWLAELLGRGIYPGEQRIGIDPLLTEVRPGEPRCSFAATHVAPTLKHFPYAFDLLREPLLRALGEGQIDPRELATIFLFDKNRVCTYRAGVPPGVRERIEDSLYKDVVFDAPFEKLQVPAELANRHRADWLLPRLGAHYDSAGLFAARGIDIAIGNAFE